jgi:predicted outer membrane protein
MREATKMNLHRAGACAAVALCFSGIAAAGKLQESELHYVRNDLERLNTSSGFAEIAVQRAGKPLVKAFAQQLIEHHAALTASLNSAMQPYAEEIHPSARGGGGAPPAGAGARAGAGGTGPAASPRAGGGATETTGPGVFSRNIKAELNGLSGDAFDEMFLLRTIQYHEDVQRRTSMEMRLAGANADILKWIDANAQKIEADTAIAQRIVLGQMTTLEQLAKGR